MTRPSRSILPRTSRNCAVITVRRFFSNTLGQTTILTMPVSSSSVRKITPLAVPGPLPHQHEARDRDAPARQLVVPMLRRW